MNKRLSMKACALVLFYLSSLSHASEASDADVLRVTSAAVHAVMEKNQIPGMSVGLVLDDKTYIFNYGWASIEDQHPVTDDTIFEIGSISKTFTATLATYAEATGKLKLSDNVASHLPELAGTDFGRLQLYHLGTHVTGGFPLQVPDEIRNHEQLINYFRTWKPPYKVGEVRTYANPSIGALGLITAKSMHQDFDAVMRNDIFEPLALKNTYINVPPQKLPAYAFGYTKQDVPVRLNPGMLSNEAYGVRTTTQDLARFLQANMHMLQLGSSLQTALDNTRKGYFNVDEMTQGLIWEEYALPADLHVLQKGNSAALIYNPTPVVAKVPPSAPAADMWVNKTGSTRGFGAYVAFVPARRFGIVILANKNYPNEERVEVAYKIFQELSP